MLRCDQGYFLFEDGIHKKIFRKSTSSIKTGDKLSLNSVHETSW